MDSPSPDSESPLPAAYATWRYLARLEATGLALLPGGDVGGVERYAQVTDGASGPGAFASLGLGVDHAR
ncbi:MAG TPA: hypothetical protein VFZ09_25920 [Archangium sp.]|uniref:hypothetical protein n=1 Tax=Archangium sp. TaxID=1872627 RepID=UPI002E37E29D|nr:hypothetical protein [Archangium sp.]HEX5749695.1 hypothetical protein [Archangium sp.]